MATVLGSIPHTNASTKSPIRCTAPPSLKIRNAFETAVMGVVLLAGLLPEAKSTAVLTSASHITPGRSVPRKSTIVRDKGL